MRTMNIYPKRQYKFKGLLTQTYNLECQRKNTGKLNKTSYKHKITVAK